MTTWTYGTLTGPSTVAQTTDVHLTFRVVVLALATDVGMTLAASQTIDIHIDFGYQHYLGWHHGPQTPVGFQGVARILNANIASWVAKTFEVFYMLKQALV